MARSLTLARFPPKSFSSASTPRSSSLSIRALARRFLSAYGPKAQLIELDLDSSSSSSSCDSSGDVEVLAIRKLEDVIHNIIVRRSAPDWLPFRPGSSYWVPPKPRGGNIVDLVDKLANPLTEEETLSFTSVRGWPCSTFFLQGNSLELSDASAKCLFYSLQIPSMLWDEEHCLSRTGSNASRGICSCPMQC